MFKTLREALVFCVSYGDKERLYAERVDDRFTGDSPSALVCEPGMEMIATFDRIRNVFGDINQLRSQGRSPLENFMSETADIVIERLNEKGQFKLFGYAKECEPTLTIIRGLPGSGKTTRALEMKRKDPNLVRVNKDEIRIELHGGVYSPENELAVRSTWGARVLEALFAYSSVVVDDAGLLNPKTLEAVVELIDGRFEIVIDDSLLDVPLSTCFRQNAKRANGVPESVITQMRDRYLPQRKREHDPSKPNVIICDMDGCLGNKHPDRAIFDWSKAGGDTVNQPIRSIVNAISNNHPGTQLVILTGRENTPLGDTNGREILLEWLDKNFIIHDGDQFLFMREYKDRTKPAEFKRGILETYILPNYNVELLIDDDPTVIEMAQSLGIPTIQPNFLNS